MAEKSEIAITANDPILPKILEIMQLIYHHYDPTNTPIEICGWWRLVSLSYRIPKWDPLDLVEATLHIYEYHMEKRRKHFEVDLVYPCIRNQFTLKQHRTPPDILSSVGELKTHVKDTLSLRRLVREEAYYDQLVEHDVLSQQEFDCYRNKEHNSGWGGTCPVCFDSKDGKGSHLIACVSCGMLGCANAKCYGHDICGIEQSAINAGETYCRSCNGKGKNAMLVPCTQCHSRWINPRHHPCCLGRPVPLETTFSPGWLDIRRNKFTSQPRQHLPVIAPCDECWEEETDGWLSCKNRLCWSRNGIMCKDCSPNGGVECAGGHHWFCDDCVSQRQPLECGCDNDLGESEQFLSDS